MEFFALLVAFTGMIAAHVVVTNYFGRWYSRHR